MKLPLRKNKNKPKTLIVFPPQWTPQNPHSAITSLAGHLRKHGYEVALRDLNVEFYDHVLTPQYIDYSKQKTLLVYNYLFPRTFLRNLAKDHSVKFQLEGKQFLEIEKFLDREKNPRKFKQWERMPYFIDQVKNILRNPSDFYDPSKLADAFTLVDVALEMISLPYYPNKLSFNNMSYPLCLLNLENIIEYCNNRESELFAKFYEHVFPTLEDADIVSVSICSFSQIIPGLILCQMLKKKLPKGVYVNIGGNFFTRVKDALLKKPLFFETFADNLIIGEGEKPLLELVRVMEQKRDIEEVPSLLYLTKENDQNKVCYTFDSPPEKLDNLGIQDLAGLPLHKYFTPHIVSCIQTSRGCYWGKCSFCDSDFGVNHDKKSLDNVVEEIKYLKEKYNIHNFEFVDESIKPEDMKVMSERFIKEKLNISWFSNGRTERAFSRDILRTLHEAGLTVILWGFESGNDRIMKLINKGVDLDKRFDVLRDAAEVGIWNFAYIFFGFPTETKGEAYDTIKALCTHKDIIHSYGRSVFTLGKHTQLKEDAKNYGILDIIEDTQEFSTNLYFKTAKGLTEEELDKMLDECTEICCRAYGEPLWMHLRYRENLHLYLVKHGRDFVRDYCFSNETMVPKELANLVW